MKSFNQNMSMINNVRSEEFTLIFVTKQTGTSRRLLIGNGNRLFGYWNGGKNQLYNEQWLSRPGHPPSDDDWDIYAITRNLTTML